MPYLKHLSARPGAFVRSMRDVLVRERQFVANEILKVRGLMPLLMKPRNGQRWTEDDKGELTAHLRRLSSISPHLVVLAMPGGMLMLPVLAWWLDRRRNRKRGGAAVPR